MGILKQGFPSRSLPLAEWFLGLALGDGGGGVLWGVKNEWSAVAYNLSKLFCNFRLSYSKMPVFNVFACFITEGSDF